MFVIMGISFFFFNVCDSSSLQSLIIYGDLTFFQEGGRKRGSEVSFPGFLVNMYEAKTTVHIFKLGNSGIKKQLYFFLP